jgi:quinohemoprotein ethanol dehydrogenase
MNHCVLKPIAAAVLSATTVGAISALVDGSRIENADRDPGNWLTYWRTYGEQR